MICSSWRFRTCRLPCAASTAVCTLRRLYTSLVGDLRMSISRITERSIGDRWRWIISGLLHQVTPRIWEDRSCPPWSYFVVFRQFSMFVGIQVPNDGFQIVVEVLQVFCRPSIMQKLLARRQMYGLWFLLDCRSPLRPSGRLCFHSGFVSDQMSLLGSFFSSCASVSFLQVMRCDSASAAWCLAAMLHTTWKWNYRRWSRQRAGLPVASVIVSSRFKALWSVQTVNRLTSR